MNYGMASGYGSSMSSAPRSLAPYGSGYSGDEQQGDSGRGDGLDWPLGVRLLADAGPLIREIETLTQVLLSQASQGSVDAELVSKVVRDIDELRDRVVRRGTRGVVSEYTIESARQYLNNLKEALKSL
jgi:hypothetical protein